MRPVPVSVDFAFSLNGSIFPNPNKNKNDDDDDVRLARALVDNGAEDLNQLLELQSKVLEFLVLLIDNHLTGYIICRAGTMNR